MSFQTPKNIIPFVQRFVLDKNTKKELNSMKPEFGFNGLGEVVFRRTYSRDNEDWSDVVTRVVQGAMSIRKEHYFRNSLRWIDSEWDVFAHDMAISLFKMEWLPPGRGLWMMGTDFVYERGSMALNNCSATDTKDDLVHSAEWTMDGLMNGVGVGFSTNWRGNATAPDKNDSETYVIPDCREGWVTSLVKLMCSYIDSPRYGKNKFNVFDYSLIREKGLPIKGFGGQSSGPDPLIKMHKRIESFLDAFCVGELVVPANGAVLEVRKPYSHTRLIADVFNSIGACVVAGNVRRSAEIALGDVNDKDFINLKNYVDNPERMEIGWMSNNSVTLKPDDGFDDFSYIPDMAKRNVDNGEPGMINLYNMQKYGRYGKEMRDDASLCNPCFSGDTMIATADGRGSVSIKQLSEEGRDVPLYSIDEVTGEISIQLGRNPRVTGTNKKLIRVHFSGVNKDEHVDVTPNHKFLLNDGRIVEAQDLTKGDSVPQFKKRKCNDGYTRVYTPSTNNYRVEHNMISEFYEHNGSGRFNSSSNKRKDRHDAITKKHTGGSYNKRVRSIGLDDIEVYYDTGNDAKDELGAFNAANQDIHVVRNCENDGCGCAFNVPWNRREISYCSATCADTRKAIIKMRKTVHMKRTNNNMNDTLHKPIMLYKDMSEKFVNGVGKNQFANACKDAGIDCNIFDKWGDFKERANGYNHRISRIEEVEGEHIVYNITVDTNHTLAIVTKDQGDNYLTGVFTFNCGEICLENFELCNLSEVFPHRCDNLNVFNQSLKYATFYSTSVSLLPTHRPETNAVITKNRRIGVSISGIAQWVSGAAPPNWGLMNYTRLTRILRDGYNIVRTENTRLAKAAGVPESIRVTTIKPSGSISLLAGATPGVHYPISRYAIRRVRIGTDSPLVPALKAAGIPHESDTYSDNTLVFEFTIDHGDVRPCEEVSPWEQFSLVAMLQRCWADNMVSATVYFDKKKDANDVEKLLAMFIPVLKSVSMLPHSGHGYVQAPYEPIDKDEYEKRRGSYKNPKFTNVKGSVPVGSKFCDGDHCEL